MPLVSFCIAEQIGTPLVSEGIKEDQWHGSFQTLSQYELIITKEVLVGVEITFSVLTQHNDVFQVTY